MVLSSLFHLHVFLYMAFSKHCETLQAFAVNAHCTGILLLIIAKSVTRTADTKLAL